MTVIKIAFISALLCSVSLFVSAQEETAPQDEIILKNGSRLIGTITASRDGVVTIDTDFAGTLSVSSDEIQSLQTQASLIVEMADGQVFENQPILIEGEQVTVTSDSGDSLNYALADILLVNPEPWERGDGYKSTGKVDFAWVKQRGNTETDELDYRLESIWRSLEDRFTLRFDGEIDEANGQKNADNWKAIGKYDYFLENNWYAGVNVGAEADDFADLDLRYYVGPYMGREFYTESIFHMEGELGLVYTNEDFQTAPDDDYIGANWGLRISSDYLGGGTKLYMNHDAIWNLNETSDIILNTAIGLSFPLLGNLEAAAEILYEYDSGSVAGVEDLDETYNFRIGYTW